MELLYPSYHTGRRQARSRHILSPTRLLVALLLSLACCCVAPARAWAVDDALVYPSTRESVIVPGRDFYIVGTAENAATRGVRVEVFAGNDTTSAATPIRSLVYDNTRNLSAAVGKAVPAIDNYFNTPAIAESALLMPDLSYDPAIIGSNAVPANKIAASDKNFAALILGGRSDGLGITAESALAAGSYTIKVTLGINTADTSDDSVLTRAITLATTSDKVMARFSPGDHYAAVEAYAAANDWRMYLDPFPGYWSPQNLKCIYYDGSDVPYTGGDIFLETYRRWRLADSMEYEAGTVHCVLYNISPTCATQTVEMGVMEMTNRIDTDLACLYYTIGEPSITIRGQVIALSNLFTELPAGDKLVYTRGHIAADVGDENMYATYLDQDVTLDADFSDGIDVVAGEEFALFGVTAPIQNDPATELVFDSSNGSYSIARKVASISYSFVKDGQEVCIATKPVELVRDFAATWTGQRSIYEFKHDFATGSVSSGSGASGAVSVPVSTAATATTLGVGSYTVTATALDTDGAPVAGGVETFTLDVQAPASQLARAGDGVHLSLGSALALAFLSASCFAACICYRRRAS